MGNSGKATYRCTYLLGGGVDVGRIIERRIIDIYKTDAFHSVAQRVYENEISMLVEAIEKSNDRHLKMVSFENYEIHKRMPQSIEENLMEMFNQYKKTMQKTDVIYGKDRFCDNMGGQQ